MDRAVQNASWAEQFRTVYQRSLAAYEAGRQTADSCVSAEDLPFLASIGCSAQELFDFVEDFSWAKEPSFEEAFGVAALRRDWFLAEQGGRPSGRVRKMAEFPAKTAALSGVEWLPRILLKAEAKLRGELPPDLMYGCGGDRAFLKRVRFGLTEFLTLVRDAKGDAASVVAQVKARMA